jgi:hypothetical protein
MLIHKSIELIDDDEKAYLGLTDPKDQAAFIAAKFAALHADAINDCLTRGSVLALLSQDDQDFLGSLIATTQAMDAPAEIKSSVDKANSDLGRSQPSSPADPAVGLGGDGND